MSKSERPDPVSVAPLFQVITDFNVSAEVKKQLELARERWEREGRNKPPVLDFSDMPLAIQPEE